MILIWKVYYEKGVHIDTHFFTNKCSLNTISVSDLYCNERIGCSKNDCIMFLSSCIFNTLLT